MKNWEDCLVLKKIAIREALELLDRLATQILLVVDDQRHLLGTLTDGDTRRALLSGKSLTDSIEDIIYKSPLYVFEGHDSKDVLELMREKKIHQVPVLNTDGSVIGLKVIDDFLQKPERSENVFIMAGGLGSRLGELTKSTPKPMLNVGGKPILERILDNFSEQGFKKFYISINYLGQQIKDYFGDGQRCNVEICYIQEEKRLGTAGSLSLLPERQDHPLIVINSDLLVKHDFISMVDHHLQSGADATVGVREFQMQVPFGVVYINLENLIEIEEKPTHKFLINGGVYVLSQQAIDFIPQNKYHDMPMLLKELLRQNMAVKIQELENYWMDIGHPHEYEAANNTFGLGFKSH